MQAIQTQHPINTIGETPHLETQHRHISPRPTSILFAYGQNYSRRLSDREVRGAHIIRGVTQLISIVTLTGILASLFFFESSSARDAALSSFGSVASLFALIESFQSSGLDNTKEKRTRRATDALTYIANAINTGDSINKDINAREKIRPSNKILETHNYLDSIDTLKEYIYFIQTKLSTKSINGISPAEMAKGIYEILEKVNQQTTLQKVPFIKFLKTIEEFLRLCKSDMETLRGDREPAIYITNEQFHNVTEMWNALENIFTTPETLDNRGCNPNEQNSHHRTLSQNLHGHQPQVIPVKSSSTSNSTNTKSEGN